MRIAALYDIHGNLPALEAVLAELDSVDHVVVGGDVFPGPMAPECLSLLTGLDAPVRFLMGNGDREVLERAQGRETDLVPERFRGVLRWHAARLVPEHQAMIAAWPKTVCVETPDVGRVLFCHATPRDDNETFTKRTPDDRIALAFAGAEVDLVVCGHTHMQFDRTVDGLRVVNAGSVGMPFGEPGAYWMLIDREVQFRRTMYDLKDAARRVRATEYPDADAFAAGSVLHPPSEEQMLQAFG